MLTAVRSYFGFTNSFLIYNLVARNLKVRYRGSLAGMLWTVLIPAFTSLIYYIVFKFILKVSIPNYLTFIISGLIPWTFFSQAVSAGLESLVNNISLLNKVPLPPQSLILSETYTNFLNLIFSLPVLVVIVLAEGLSLNLYMLQYFFFAFTLFLITNSVSLILGFLYVYFRDLKFLTSIVLQFWFYLTPVIYSKDMIPSNYFFLYYLNPIGILFISLHKSILEPTLLPVESYAVTSLWTLFFALLSSLILKKYRQEVIESL